jgi:hypothetical protein
MSVGGCAATFERVTLRNLLVCCLHYFPSAVGSQNRKLTIDLDSRVPILVTLEDCGRIVCLLETLNDDIVVGRPR